jgi:short-subunit dehydrogenase
MLILNAGWGDAFHGHLMPEEWVTSMTIMNVAQIPYLTTKLLPLIKARHHQKSAIVIVSSIAAILEGPFG